MHLSAKQKKMQSVLRCRPFKQPTRTLSSVLSVFRDIKQKHNYISIQQEHQHFKNTIKEDYKRNTKIKLPFQQDRQEQKVDLSLTIHSKSSHSPPKEVSLKKQRVKTVSDVNPKIYRLKLFHLRNSDRGSSGTQHNHFQKFIKGKGNQKKRGQTSQRLKQVSCDRQTVDKMRQLVDKVNGNRGTERYKEIPVEQFIYENRGALVRKEVVQKIARMRRVETVCNGIF